jgi:hypothetical protein
MGCDDFFEIDFLMDDDLAFLPVSSAEDASGCSWFWNLLLSSDAYCCA